jgi:hypothetical protein
MTDPGRLFDSGSSDERALLVAARSLRANAASRQRALVSLGVLSALTLAPATAIAALKWIKGVSASALGVLGSQWGVGIVITTVAVGAVTVHVTQRTTGPNAALAVSAPAPVRGAVPPLQVPAEASVATPAEEEPVAAPLPIESAGPRPSRSVSKPSTAPTEIELIDSARERLRSGNASGALAVLGEHRRAYPGGSLSTEARVLRIEALAASGQREQALKEARQFLQQHPNGLLSHRVRRWLDSQETR